MVRLRPFKLLFLPVLWSHAFERNTPEAEMVRATAGADCTLPCGGPPNATVLVLQWSRLDLEPHGYLLFYRRLQLETRYQHPAFTDRVQVRDLDHGDLSVVLKNLTVNDSGTYECRLLLMGRVKWRHTVNLTVEGTDSWIESSVTGQGRLPVVGATARGRLPVVGATGRGRLPVVSATGRGRLPVVSATVLLLLVFVVAVFKVMCSSETL